MTNMERYLRGKERDRKWKKRYWEKRKNLSCAVDLEYHAFVTETARAMGVPVCQLLKEGLDRRVQECRELLQKETSPDT